MCSCQTVLRNSALFFSLSKHDVYGLHWVRLEKELMYSVESNKLCLFVIPIINNNTGNIYRTFIVPLFQVTLFNGIDTKD